MPPTILVLDFDGTLTTSDVGDDLCDHLAPPSWRAIDALWVGGQLSLPEAQRRMWALARASRSVAVNAARTLGRLRPGLEALLDGAAARGVEVWLASGGFDFYIEALLGAHLPRFARGYWNRMRFDGQALAAEFPHAELSCETCAVCKGRVCDLARAQGARVIFAGDGYSDRCALGRADLLLAVRGSHLARQAGGAATEFDALDELVPLL